MAQTPLYYGSVDAIEGLTFTIGTTTLFAPTCDTTIYALGVSSQLFIQNRVPEAMAHYLTQTVIEPRLARLGERR
jgi:hypothetical protein